MFHYGKCEEDRIDRFETSMISVAATTLYHYVDSSSDILLFIFPESLYFEKRCLSLAKNRPHLQSVHAF